MNLVLTMCIMPLHGADHYRRFLELHQTLLQQISERSRAGKLEKKDIPPQDKSCSEEEEITTNELGFGIQMLHDKLFPHLAMKLADEGRLEKALGKEKMRSELLQIYEETMPDEDKFKYLQDIGVTEQELESGEKILYKTPKSTYKISIITNAAKLLKAGRDLGLCVQNYEYAKENQRKEKRLLVLWVKGKKEWKAKWLVEFDDAFKIIKQSFDKYHRSLKTLAIGYSHAPLTPKFYTIHYVEYKRILSDLRTLQRNCHADENTMALKLDMGERQASRCSVVE